MIAVGLGLADADVIEGEVEDARILDEPVIRDDRDAGCRGGLEGRTHGLVVLGKQDDDVGALLDERVDVRDLLLGARGSRPHRCTCRRLPRPCPGWPACRGAAQRGCWKLFHETPTVQAPGAAIDAAGDCATAAPVEMRPAATTTAAPRPTNPRLALCICFLL